MISAEKPTLGLVGESESISRPRSERMAAEGPVGVRVSRIPWVAPSQEGEEATPARSRTE